MTDLRPTRRAALAGALAALAAPARAAADPAPADPAPVDPAPVDPAPVDPAFAAPGVHVLMRHALAPGTGDPPGFRLDDPATQRNLSDAGRAQARAAGALLRAAGVRFDAVWSSPWSRCVETARLMDLGPVAVEPAFGSFFGDRGEGPARTAAALALFAALPAGAKALAVTHQVNVTALTGVVPASGELLAVRVGPDGRLATLARLRAPLD
jgi:phosphohistidine phosphatase SixA